MPKLEDGFYEPTPRNRLVIVPIALSNAIYKAIDEQLTIHPEAMADREVFYDNLLCFYDDNGYVPEFVLAKKDG